VKLEKKETKQNKINTKQKKTNKPTNQPNKQTNKQTNKKSVLFSSRTYLSIGF